MKNAGFALPLQAFGLGIFAVLLLIGMAQFTAASDLPVINLGDEGAALNANAPAPPPFICDSTDIICDPVPGSTQDTQIYARGAKIIVNGSVQKMTGGNAFYGDIQLFFPTITSGVFTMEVRGLTDDNRITIPYFIQFNNGKGSFDKTEWQTTLRKGMKARMELAWYGCCEAANYQGPRAPVMDAAGGFYTLTYKWDSANVYLYQGRGTAISAIHSLPNRLGSFMPSDWKNGCKSRATKGSIIPLKIELPERHYGLAFKYWFRNFKLTKIK